jgi:hypothetical protein
MQSHDTTFEFDDLYVGLKIKFKDKDWPIAAESILDRFVAHYRINLEDTYMKGIVNVDRLKNEFSIARLVALPEEEYEFDFQLANVGSVFDKFAIQVNFMLLEKEKLSDFIELLEPIVRWE